MFDYISNLVQDNLPLALAAGGVLAFLAYRKFKVFVAVVLMALLLAGVYTLVSDMGSKGTGQKARMVSTPEIPR